MISKVDQKPLLLRKTLSVVEDPTIKLSLGYSVMDGVMWSMMFGLAENYITPFVLFFGASIFEVSLLQGLTQLAIGGGQLVGGTLSLKLANRKSFMLKTVVVQALSWIVTYWGTVLTHSPLVGILLYCLGVVTANLSSPGWISWMNDLIPVNLRGVYWSQRNLVQGTVQFLAISIAGFSLFQAHTRGWDEQIYGVLFFLAFLFRMGSTFFLYRSHEPQLQKSDAAKALSFLKFLKTLPGTNFGSFVLFITLINFTLAMTNPTIQVYLLEKLKFNYLQYTAITMIATIANFVFMTYWGPLSDQFGNRLILIVGATLLPLVAVGWLLLTNFWALLALQLLSGFLTSALGLSTNNYIFDSIPSERIPKVMGYFNALNTLFAFGGAIFSGILGQFILDSGWHLGFLGPFLMVFLVAAILRFLIIAIFARRFQEVRPAEPSPGLHYFYFYKPFQDAMLLIGSTAGVLVQGVRALNPRTLHRRWRQTRVRRNGK
ncbi:MAG: MFS transporter [Spirochaetales bacterium]|nr:MFS transporter [Spirochaetales bacterium]